MERQQSEPQLLFCLIRDLHESRELKQGVTEGKAARP